MMIPSFGVDNLKQYTALLNGKRAGVLTNPSGVDSRYRDSVAVLKEYCTVTALFGPEHGIRGDFQAGIRSEADRNSRIPEFILHGCSDHLTERHFDLMDCLIFDIQDIGSRFYTYIYTLFSAMEDCAKQGLPVIILDRPNPLGGTAVEGTMMRHGYEGCLGREPFAARTGLTAGELAQMVNDRFHIGCDLTVIPCGGLTRDILFCDTGRSWINPSPNMQSMDCAMIYNGTCFFEATNISEGRGTTRPYEIIGSPFLENDKICRIVSEYGLPGAVFRPCFFRPTFSKYKEELCRGIQIHITDPRIFNGFDTGMALWYAIRDNTPEFEITDPDHLNSLFGDDQLLKGRESLAELRQRAVEESCTFQKISADYYIY